MRGKSHRCHLDCAAVTDRAAVPTVVFRSNLPSAVNEARGKDHKDDTPTKKDAKATPTLVVSTEKVSKCNLLHLTD